MPLAQALTFVTLPRELTDISEEVRQVPAPILPVMPAPYSIRVADPEGDDPEMVAEWMSRPHLVSTWEQNWTPARWREDMRARRAGTYSTPCVVSYDMAALGKPTLGVRPFMYLEVYRAAKDEIARFYPADPWDIGLHVAVADPDLLDRRLVAAASPHFVLSYFTAEERCRRLIGDPEHRDDRMRRAAGNYGFTFLGEHQVRPERRVALYCLPRTPDDLPETSKGASKR